ncbi:MAG: agmatinase family protein [Ilumatobacteraceae bacterium]
MAGVEGEGAWKIPVDRSNEPSREPGPIDINRYAVPSGAFAGIPTFMGLPIALNPDDLRAGDVDVAVVGAPCDTGSGRRGAAWGPRGLRTAEQYIPWGQASLAVIPDQNSGITPFSELTCVDYGDINVDPLDLEASHVEIRNRVREIIEAGTMPVVLGGDHSIMRPDVAAMADVYGAGNVGVIHFDAHYDAMSDAFGQPVSHGTMIRRLLEEEHLLGKNFVQIGLRGWVPSNDDMEWMRSQEIKSHYMAEIERDGLDAVMERAIAEASDGPEYLFISFDIDTLDPVYAPGTGTPEPGGLTTREAFPWVRRLCAETNVVGMELVEVAPLLDPSYVTAYNGLRIVQQAITGWAMRRRGLTDPHYLDPKRSGQDPVPGQRTD